MNMRETLRAVKQLFVDSFCKHSLKLNSGMVDDNLEHLMNTKCWIAHIFLTFSRIIMPMLAISHW